MKDLFKLTLLLFLFSSFTANGKDDIIPAIIVNSNNDTLQVNIVDRIVKGKFIDIHQDKAPRIIRKSASEIKSVFIDGTLTIRSYRVIYNKIREDIFIELLIDGGNIGIYKGKHEKLGTLYMMLKNNQLSILNKNDLASSYSYLYGDCNSFNANEKFSYNDKDIIETFRDYARCQNIEVSVDSVRTNKYKADILLGPKIGYLWGNFEHGDIGYFTNGEYSPIQSPVIGISLKTIFPKRFFIQTEFSYYSKTSYSDNVNTPPLSDPDFFSRVEYDFSLLEFQLVLGYSFIKRAKIHPVLAFGFSYDAILNNKFSNSPNRIPEGDLGPPIVDFGNSREFGWSVLWGLTYSPNNKNVLQLLMKSKISSRYYGVYRNSPNLGGYGTGDNALYSLTNELSLTYYFKY